MRDEDIADFAQFLREFQAETDRGAALVAGALIDLRLKETLAGFMINCREATDLLSGERGGPLGTFSARINACFALGLLTAHERTECHLIRKIRNEFAHRAHGTTFADEKISSLSHSLRSDLPGGTEAFRGNPRSKFINAAILIALALRYRGEWAALEKRTVWKHPDVSSKKSEDQ